MITEDAANSRARMIVLVDAALEVLMMTVYIGFELLGGGDGHVSFSYQDQHWQTPTPLSQE